MVFALAGDSTITKAFLDALDFAIIEFDLLYSVAGFTPFNKTYESPIGYFHDKI